MFNDDVMLSRARQCLNNDELQFLSGFEPLL